MSSKECHILTRNVDSFLFTMWGQSFENASEYKNVQSFCPMPAGFDSKECEAPIFWGPRLNRTAILGTASSMVLFCNNGMNDFQSNGTDALCKTKGYNLYRKCGIGPGCWDMCDNTRWLMCAVNGRACYDANFIPRSNCNPNILLTHSSRLAPTAAPNDKLSEDHIFTMELCMLNEMCSNGHELFRRKKILEEFRCHFDNTKWKRYHRDIVRIIREQTHFTKRTN